MANLDELQRLDVEIRVAERRAVEGLAEHLRDAVRDLPSQSRLALVFVQQARNLDSCARESTPRLGAKHYLREIEREARDLDNDDQDGGDA